MSDLPALSVSYARLRTWATRHAHEVRFRPPADPAIIDSFIQKSGLSLPDDLRQAWLIADGETRTSAGMIGNWRLLPVAESQAAWGLLTNLAEKGAFAGQEAQSPPYLRKAWWHPAWLPIAGNDEGDFFCLDTDPPETARAGQVLLFFRARPERPLIAGSLTAWLDRIARDLEAGVYTYDEMEGFNGEAFLWSALQGKHLLDGQGGDGELVS